MKLMVEMRFNSHTARKEITKRADAFLAARLLDRADTTGVPKGGPTCS